MTDAIALVPAFAIVSYQRPFYDDSIAECSGRPLHDPFEYVTNNAKGTYSSTTLVDAMMKYGSRAGRLSTKLSKQETDYLIDTLDPSLMRLLHYPYESFDG